MSTSERRAERLSPENDQITQLDFGRLLDNPAGQVARLPQLALDTAQHAIDNIMGLGGLKLVQGDVPVVPMEKQSERAAKDNPQPKRDGDAVEQPQEKEKRLAKQKELEDRYGVTFNSEKDGSFKFNGKDFPLRSPTYQEVLAIESALSHAQPSHKVGDRGVAFQFLAKDVLPNVDGFYHRGTIYVQPMSGKIGHLMHDTTKPYLSTRDTDSFEAVIVHELAHNTERNIDSEFDFGGTFSPTQNKIAELLGYKRGVDEVNDKSSIWMIQAKTKTDGINYDLFKFQSIDNTWVRCNAKGEPQIKSRNDILKSDDMRIHALVEPATIYFTKPSERLAEALTQLRLGGLSLAELKKHPYDYKVATLVDQLEIDKVYGLSKEHPNGLVRADNGTLRDATAEERAAIRPSSESLLSKVDAWTKARKQALVEAEIAAKQPKTEFEAGLRQIADGTAAARFKDGLGKVADGTATARFQDGLRQIGDGTATARFQDGCSQLPARFKSGLNRIGGWIGLGD